MRGAPAASPALAIDLRVLVAQGERLSVRVPVGEGQALWTVTRRGNELLVNGEARGRELYENGALLYEEGRYEDLPGGVFTVNYIRQYAAMTGYDAEVILEHYRSRNSEDSPVQPPRKQPPRGWIRFFESA